MKILIFSAQDFVEGNGANSRIKAYAQGFREEGEDVELLFVTPSSFSTGSLNTEKKGIWKGIPFRFLNGSSQRPKTLTGKIIDSLSGLFHAFIYLIQKGSSIDIAYFYSLHPLLGWPLYLLCKIKSCKVVMELTELRSSYPTDKANIFHSINRKLFRLEEKYCKYYVDHLFVISSKLFRYHSQFMSTARITKIPIVVDYSRFSGLNGYDYLKKRIGYLGSFGPKDGVNGIIAAFEKAREKYPDLRLRLMGYDSGYDSIENEKFSGLNGNVEFMGRVEYDKIPSLLNDCDLLIVNRTDHEYSHYGFPTKLGEYLASGKPTVVTKVGDVEQYLVDRQDVVMIQPDREDELASVISDRYLHPETYVEIGLKGKNTCLKQFDYHQHVRNMLEVFRNLQAKA